jgi:predicted tellurium resistance membrane protein TerC
VIIVSLALVAASGVLLFASDFETYLYSRFFWIKMGLVVLLMINGTILWRAEQRASAGDRDAWRTLRITAIASITLWFLTTLGGVALPNIG